MSGKVALLGLGFLFVFIFGNFTAQLLGAPSRTQTTRLEPYGEISVHLETQPDPPKIGGIPLILHITDQSGKPIALDKVHYEYSFQDRVSRQMDAESAGEGTFKATAMLTDVGEWTVYAMLSKGTQQAQVKFTVRVMANI